MMGWRIDPGGLYKEIQRVATRYGKPVMITENGIATSNDSKREWYMQNHLAAVGRAIRDGYDVRGYFAWSLAPIENLVGYRKTLWGDYQSNQDLQSIRTVITGVTVPWPKEPLRGFCRPCRP